MARKVLLFDARKLRWKKRLCVECGAPNPCWRNIDPSAPPVRGRFRGLVCNNCFTASQAAYATAIRAESARAADRLTRAAGEDKLERIEALARAIGDALGFPALSEEEIANHVEDIAALILEAALERRSRLTEPIDPDSDPAARKPAPLAESREVDPGMDSGWETSHPPSGGTRRSPRR
jgi:hypothetical protein